jgi:putative transposase
MPLDINQIDHTKMDVMIVDEKTRKSIGRPYITVAIDVFSRMIYGFYISLEATSYFSVGQCLLNAILPKDDLLKQYQVQGEWAVFGLPRKIHMDNGKDFRSVSLHNFCQEFRIEDIYRPVARPEFGGAVERVIGTCMKKLHEIPGSTSSNIFEKGSYDSEKEAVMTISELEKWYLDFVINVYHKTEHSSLGMTPEEKFYQGLLGVGEDKSIPFLPTVPANTLKLRMALLPEIKRSVQKNGITIDYITYFSETLRKWIIPTQYKRLKPNLQNSVVCRRDPRDVSKIYVYDEDIKDYITVPYADIRKPKMNLAELRASIAEAKRLITGRELEPHDIFEAYNRLHQYVIDAKTEKKSTKRKQSSKIHQDKTLQLDKERIDYKENRVVLNLNTDEDDEDGYEIYPIG